MRDHKTPQPAPQTTGPSLLESFAYSQALGNAASPQLDVQASDESYLGPLALDAGSMLSTGPSAVGDMGLDHSLFDQRDILEGASAVPLASQTLEGATGPVQVDTAELSSSGFTVGSSTGGKDALGAHAAHTRGTVDFGAGTVGASRSDELFGSTMGVGVQASKDGQFVMGGSVGDFGAQGMVDFASNGGVEAVGVGGSAKAGPFEAEGHVALHLGTVDVTGNTVSSTTGGAVGLGGKVGPVGFGSSYQAAYGEAVTFPTEKEAEAYGKALAAGEGSAVSDLSAEDLKKLPEGARAEYVYELAGKGSGGIVLTVGSQGSARQTVTMDRLGGDMLQLTVANEGGAGIRGGVEGGLGAVSVGADGLAESTSVYDVDLADPKQAEAFERFQRTGQTDGLKLRSTEQLTGSRWTSSGSMAGMSVTETNETKGGTRQDENGTHEVQEASYGSEGSMWSFAGAMETAADWTGWALGRFTPEQANAYEQAETWARAQREASGTTNGKDTGGVRVLTNKRDGSRQAVQTQVADFDDQHENARFLEDQVDRFSDGANLEGAALAGHAATDREWVLESVISNDGLQNIEDVLASSRGFPCETPEAGWAFTEEREAMRDGKGLAEALADAGATGEDAFECTRAMAGENNVEQFLSAKGDDVFMSRDEHSRLLNEVFQLDELRARDPMVVKPMARELVSKLQGRLARLDADVHPEVPTEFVVSERLRLSKLIARLGEH